MSKSIYILYETAECSIVTKDYVSPSDGVIWWRDKSSNLYLDDEGTSLDDTCLNLDWLKENDVLIFNNIDQAEKEARKIAKKIVNTPDSDYGPGDVIQFEAIELVDTNVKRINYLHAFDVKLPKVTQTS